MKSSSSKPSKPVDLAAELAAKKKNLAKVETKDLSVPNVQKNDSSSAQTGNSMMAMIMAKRNAMKKVTGPEMPISSLPKKAVQPQKSVEQPLKNQKIPNQSSTNSTAAASKKPTTNTIKPPSNNKPVGSSGGKQPMKVSGGGGGFAAMRNMLANRMAPPSTKKENEGPKKPIVELAAGSNVPRMNLSKLKASLESNLGKSESTSNEPVKVVSGSGAGVPPPPPPPPPPPIK